MATPRWITLEAPRAFLSVNEVCDILGVSEYVTRGLLESGELPSLRVGREYRIAAADLEEFINAQRGASREG